MLHLWIQVGPGQSGFWLRDLIGVCTWGTSTVSSPGSRMQVGLVIVEYPEGVAEEVLGSILVGFHGEVTDGC